jgi:hypothetical protein
MKIDFVTYSSARASDNLSGSLMTLTDTLGASESFTLVSGSIDSSIYSSNPVVNFQMTSPLSFIRGFGTGYQHFMELLLLQGSIATGNADKWGDLRLYRNDATSYVLSAYCSSLKGHNALATEKQGAITLHSFDRVNFFGHLRLWDKANSTTVWTYKVAAYASDTGLSVVNNSLSLALSTSTSPIEDYILKNNPFPVLYPMLTPKGPVPTYPGVLTVELENDKLKVNTLSLNFDDMYDAAANSIVMKASYKP